MDSSAMSQDIDMDSFPDADEPRSFDLPPHIAARFSHKTSARRRSSAQSSRRSSISSRHSHHSTLSAHGGPQSTHVAQHLRRASIIESRKARLADRAAHAEQVRLRAALAKAAPRAAYREERALAAQAAREKLLADITARCEEEVRRAKKVAEETKEKKAAEHARLKEEMAEKLAEAARRRSLYQRSARRPRGASLPSVEEKRVSPVALRHLSEEAAAKVLQQAWRTRKQRQAMSAFVELDLSLQRVQDMPFELVGQLLAQERVLKTTTSLLNALRASLGPNADAIQQTPTDGLGADTRTFLSTYLVLGHPLQALSNGGKQPQEMDLIAKAQDLIHSFEAILQFHQNSRSVPKHKLPSITPAGRGTPLNRSSIEQFNLLFSNYKDAFTAWKACDASALIDIMVNQFVELDSILQTVKDDQAGGVADDYYQAIRHNQIQLLARLKKFTGHDAALARVRAAVRKARKQRASKLPSPQHTPRSSTGESASSQPAEALPARSSDLVQATRISLGHDLGASSFVSRLGQTMTVLPSNREIAHEIQIMGTYEVQQQPWTESRKHFMDSLRASMRQSMSQGGAEAAASWTHAMAILIRDKLLTLVSRNHPLYERIDGFLDPKLIDQTCRAGMFSYESFFETIAGLIGRICSPGRDEAVAAFAADKTSDSIDRLFSLMNVIDLMTLDHINFAFRAASTAVIERGHEHERSAFEKNLHDGRHTVVRTRQWWNTARSNLVAGPGSPHGTTIYARALVDLVLSNTHLTFNSLPETLHLDWLRLLSLRARSLKIVAISSILLTTKIRLRRNREAQWTKDAERLMALDFADTEPARVVAVIESSHLMPEATKEGLLNFVGRVLPPAAAAARNSMSAEQQHRAAIQNGEAYDPSSADQEPPVSDSVVSTDDAFTEQVATFVLKSLREHVFARLAASSTAEKVRVNTSAAEVLARAGMPEFVAEVGTMVQVLDKVRTVDLRSHEPWYTEIAAAAAATTTTITTTTTESRTEDGNA